MRKIRPLEIVAFNVLLAVALVCAGLTSYGIGRVVGFGEFHAVAMVGLGVVSLYVYGLIVFRLFLKAFPLKPGFIPASSPQEFVYHVYLLFFLILFHPLIRGGVVPVPLMRLVYLALGARLGDNTYSSGVLFDPIFISIGSNTIVGHGALLIPHVVEGSLLAHYPITVGHNVTVGAYATILSGAVVGDDAIVAIGAVVAKGTRIGPGEIWGGVPARLIGRRAPEGEASR